MWPHQTIKLVNSSSGASILEQMNISNGKAVYSTHACDPPDEQVIQMLGESMFPMGPCWWIPWYHQFYTMALVLQIFSSIFILGRLRFANNRYQYRGEVIVFKFLETFAIIPVVIFANCEYSFVTCDHSFPNWHGSVSFLEVLLSIYLRQSMNMVSFLWWRLKIFLDQLMVVLV